MHEKHLISCLYWNALLTRYWFICLFIDYITPTMNIVCIMAVSTLTSVIHILLSLQQIFLSCACIGWLTNHDTFVIFSEFFTCMQNAALYHLIPLILYKLNCCKKSVKEDCEICSFHVAFACLDSSVCALNELCYFDNESLNCQA